MKIIAAFAVGLALAVALPAVSAQAQNARSFVSPTGSDNNNCTLALPCRTFQAALALTNAGGEIAVLGTAGYGVLTINKGISIVNPGAFEAGIIVPSGGAGIVINAGPTDAVSLHGLTIEGGGVGQTGIALTQAHSLLIENCTVRNLTSSGIALAPIIPSTITVSKTLVTSNGGHGIYVQPSGNFTVKAVFNRVETYNNSLDGIGIFGNLMNPFSILKAIVVDSVAGNNNGQGFHAFSAPTVLSIFRSVTFGNVSAGVRAESGGIIYISESNVQDDSWQYSTGSCVYTYGDNSASTGVAPCGVVSKQ